MLTMPVCFGDLKRAAATILNCSIMEAPGGIFGIGKSGDTKLFTQTLPLLVDCQAILKARERPTTYIS
jgi:hypothetical protein